MKGDYFMLHSLCTNNKVTKGFTLIELLVVIAIIAILAAILFPVFARAREKARQTTCTSNQRQISASVMMYTQDHEESLPPAESFWSDVKMDPGALICPTAGKNVVIGYNYNGALAGVSLGDQKSPDNVLLTSDGTGGTTTYVAKTALRHSGKLIASYLDGHVNTSTDCGPWGEAFYATFRNVNDLSASGTEYYENAVYAGTNTNNKFSTITDGPKGRTAIKIGNYTATRLSFVPKTGYGVNKAILNKMTVGFWYRQENTSFTTGGGDETVVTSGVYAGGGFTMWVNDGMVKAQATGTNTYGVRAPSATATITKQVWHHVTGTFDLSPTTYPAVAKIYIDGALVTTGTNGAWYPIEPAISAFSGPVQVGKNWGGNQYDYSVSDIRIYQRMLSDEEITVLAEN